MSSPIVGICKLDGEIVGVAFHDLLLTVSPIFRETRELEEMTLPVLSNVDGEDTEMMVGDLITVPKGSYKCIVMEDKRELRVLMSISRITSTYHLVLLDKLCIEATDLIEQYIASFYANNERLLLEVSKRQKKEGTINEPGPLGNGILRPSDDYPDGLVLPDRQFLCHSDDIRLVDAIIAGRFKRMPDEAIDILKSKYILSLRRYILSSFHHAHLCIEEPFFPMGMTMGVTEHDVPYIIREVTITLPLHLLYLRDVLMTMKLIPFDEDVIIKRALGFIGLIGSVLLAHDDIQHMLRIMCRHPYVVAYRTKPFKGLSILSNDDFMAALSRDSNGIINESFDWNGFVLTGSTIFSLLLGTNNHSDYDIVCLGSGTEEELMAVYEEKFKPLGFIAETVYTAKSFRLRLTHETSRSIDLYFGTKQSIGMYHSAPTNAFFDGTNVCLYPRAFHCLTTGIISDLVPLSRDRGLALRVKTLERYRSVGVVVHVWHEELMTYADATTNYTNPIAEHIRDNLMKAIAMIHNSWTGYTLPDQE